MPIVYKKKVAVLDGVCDVEDAESLWAWLQKNPKAKINLKGCQHVHSAVLQVLMKAAPAISIAPQDARIKAWIGATLQGSSPQC